MAATQKKFYVVVGHVRVGADKVVKFGEELVAKEHDLTDKHIQQLLDARAISTKKPAAPVIEEENDDKE